MELHHLSRFYQPRNTFEVHVIVYNCGSIPKIIISHSSLTPRLPLNWRTPKGYMISFSIQLFWMVGGAVVVFFIILVYSGICKVFGAFSLDINKSLNDLNDIAIDAQHNKTNHNRIEIVKRFHAIVAFHSQTKQLSYSENRVRC